MHQPHIALVSARAAQDLDEDLAPLRRALEEAGARAVVANWDDPEVDWGSFDLALLRSTWDYSFRMPEFRAWADVVSSVSRLLNPLSVVTWNTDKHYLAELEGRGVPIVPSVFIEPSGGPTDAPSAGAPRESAREPEREAIVRFLEEHGTAREIVVKPAVGSGSRDVQRHPRTDLAAIRAHVARLTSSGRSAFLQPYLERVNTQGETALMYFAGRYSHAVRKGPLLRAGEGPTQLLFAPEEITPRVAAPEELAVADRVLAATPGAPLLYARVDLIRDDADQPRLLELELTEPSLFFNYAPGSAQRFAREIINIALV